MIANEERLALVLEANDKASAILKKVRQEIQDTADAASKGGKNARGLSDAVEGVSDTKLLKGARAMGSIAQAADQAKFGVKEMSRAAGELAETLALASGNAKFAGWAIALNAAVVAGGALVGVLQKAMYAQAPTEDQIKRINKLTKDRADQELQGIRRAHDAALGAITTERSALDLLWNGTGKRDFLHNLVDVTGLSSEARRQAQRTGKLLELTTDQDVDRSEAEKNRLLALGDQTRELAKQKDVATSLGEVQLRSVRHQADSLELSRAEALAAKRSADLQTEAMFRHRDEDGKLHVLTAAELAMRNKLLENNREAYGLSVQSAKAKYDEQIKDDKFTQDQTVWYAKRRLAQTDFLNSLDSARQAYEQQMHALENSGKLAADIKIEQGKVTDAYTLQVQLLQQQHDLQTSRLRAQNNVDAADGGLIGPGSAREQYKAKLEAIKEARQAAIKAGEDEVEANRRAELDKRKLQRDTIEQAKKNYKTIEDVLLASNSRQVKAVGHAVQTIRRLEIGVEGSKAAVMALREGAEALASFAHGDVAGGGLHLASAAQFAATAALAAQESLGGGTTASGGGGGGSVSGSGTFEPRNNGGAGTQVINVYTENPYGREQIQQVKYELGRADVLKRPGIQVPPTTGIRVG